MRMVGMLLALAAVAWVLYQAAGGGKAETARPEPYQRSMDKARSLEQSVQDAALSRMQGPAPMQNEDE